MVCVKPVGNDTIYPKTGILERTFWALESGPRVIKVI
jgi:hypothetical protein